MFTRLCRVPDMLATCCPWLHALPDAMPTHACTWLHGTGPHLERSPDCDRPCSLGLGRWRGNLGRCLIRSFHGRCCFDSPVVNRTIVSRRCFDPLPSASARALQGTRMRSGVGELGSACRAVVDAGSCQPSTEQQPNACHAQVAWEEPPRSSNRSAALFLDVLAQSSSAAAFRGPRDEGSTLQHPSMPLIAVQLR